MGRRLNIGVISKFTEASYFGGLIKAIHNFLQQHNANLFVINTFMIYSFCSEPGRDSRYYNLAFDYIDGWIVLPQGASSEYLDIIIKSGKPVVLIGFEPDKFDCSLVLEDNRHGARLITQHLIDHGHKKIAYMGCSFLYDMRERLEGYKDALEDNGILYDPDLIIMTDGAVAQYGKMAMQQVLMNKCKFTGVFAANDFLAFGAVEAMKEAGLRIPEDVAVIGYDNIAYAKKFNPSLSSMNQNIEKIGITATETVIRLIREKANPKETIYIKSDLIMRNSCGCKNLQNDDEIPSFDNLKLKDNIIDYLEGVISKNYSIASELVTIGLDEVKKLMPLISNKYSLQCIGFWDLNENRRDELFIEKIIDIKSSNVEYPNTFCPVESFPPVSFLRSLNELNSEDVIWILPISTAAKDWCTISYISPINEINILFAYDSSMILFNLLGIFLDREMANSELKETLGTLQQTLQTLQQTQEQLIQSEKMVSLGGLVAGIAHEINTPIGVSVTAASLLQERSSELMESFRTGKLKRTDLEKYLEMNSEATKVLLINLNKASNLVNSFKQIAVDQSLEEKRRFNVKQYVNEILLSLNPKLKKTKISVNVECPNDLEIYNYPGGLSRILTNMVVNSIIHGYDEGEEGTIFIKIFIYEEMINLIYSDNGKGIDKNHLSKIFDPFFTTRRGSGGTGLGLNIVYNTVTQEYGGSIKCESEPMKGTVFIVKIPV